MVVGAPNLRTKRRPMGREAGTCIGPLDSFKSFVLLLKVLPLSAKASPATASKIWRTFAADEQQARGRNELRFVGKDTGLEANFPNSYIGIISSEAIAGACLLKAISTWPRRCSTHRMTLPRHRQRTVPERAHLFSGRNRRPPSQGPSKSCET